jgi:hypothetical protein
MRYRLVAELGADFRRNDFQNVVKSIFKALISGVITSFGEI